MTPVHVQCFCCFHFNLSTLPSALLLFKYGAPVKGLRIHSCLLLYSCSYMLLLLQDYASILEHLISRWELEGMTGLSSEAQEAQEYVCKLPPRIRRLADRTLMRKEKSKKREVPFSWIYDRTINM